MIISRIEELKELRNVFIIHSFLNAMSIFYIKGIRPIEGDLESLHIDIIKNLYIRDTNKLQNNSRSSSVPDYNKLELKGFERALTRNAIITDNWLYVLQEYRKFHKSLVIKGILE